MDDAQVLMIAVDSINDFMATDKVHEQDIKNVSSVLSLMHQKLYGTSKKIFVCDHTTPKKTTVVEPICYDIKPLMKTGEEKIFIEDGNESIQKGLAEDIKVIQDVVDSSLTNTKEQELSINNLPEEQQKIYDKIMRRKKMSPKRYVLEKLLIALS